jgi:hypothetical protein
VAESARWVDRQGVPSDPGCYEERYRLTGGAALGLAASLLALAWPGLLWHSQVIIAIAAVLVAALINAELARSGCGGVCRRTPGGRFPLRP